MLYSSQSSHCLLCSSHFFWPKGMHLFSSAWEIPVFAYCHFSFLRSHSKAYLPGGTHFFIPHKSRTLSFYFLTQPCFLTFKALPWILHIFSFLCLDTCFCLSLHQKVISDQRVQEQNGDLGSSLTQSRCQYVFVRYLSGSREEAPSSDTSKKLNLNAIWTEWSNVAIIFKEELDKGWVQNAILGECQDHILNYHSEVRDTVV